MLDTTESQRRPAYIRPKPSSALAKAERKGLLQEYFEHYRLIAKTDPALLNQKLPREVFSEMLRSIGAILLEHANDLSARPGPVHDFLELNELPPSVARLLPPDFRAFCLALNALKQWVSAEQQATDCYLLGASAREELRAAAGSCLATGKSLDGDCELHHPVRDGRPPIPLCRSAHDEIEQQGIGVDQFSDPNFLVISGVRRQANNSWKNLRRGCLDLLGEMVKHSTQAVGAGSRAFARKASAASGLNYRQVIEMLDERGLGLD
jgi:hypothetical protein